MRAVCHNLLHRLRVLRRAGVGSLGTVLLLAVGTAGVLALFGPLYSLVFAPLPFPNAGELVYAGGAPIFNVFSARFPQRREMGGLFSGLAAYWGARPEWLADGTIVRTLVVTREFFPTLGVLPHWGVDFVARSGRTQVAVVSDAFWQSRFHRAWGGREAALTISGRSYRVLGVMPPKFDFPVGTDVWIMAPDHNGGPGTAGEGLAVIGRLRPGLAPTAAAARLRAIAANAHGYGLLRGDGPVLQPLHDFILGDRRPLVWSLSAAALLFLLLACAGAANLSLARSIRRQPEFALRMALGAGRARLSAEILAETFLLTAAGCLTGFLVAALTSAWLRGEVIAHVGPAAIAPPPGLLVQAGAAALLVSVATALCGAAPAWCAASSDPARWLRGGPGPGGTRHAWFGLSAREWLTVSELSLALALLIATGVLIRVVTSQVHADRGFRAKGVALVETQIVPTSAMVAANNALAAAHGRWTPALVKALRAAQQMEAARDVPVYNSVQRSFERLPGVESVGVLDPAPFSEDAEAFSSLYPSGRGGTRGQRYTLGWIRHASGNVFALLDVRLLAGRSFTEADAAYTRATSTLALGTGHWPAGRLMPVIVNRALAQLFWLGRDPVGRILYAPIPCRVIGVVSDILEGPAHLAPVPTVYQVADPSNHMSFLLRFRPGAAVPKAAIARAAAGISADIAPPRIAGLPSLVRRATLGSRFALDVLAAFALLGTVAAGLAVYLSSEEMMSARAREFAIRIAVGAHPFEIYRTGLARCACLALAAVPAGSLTAALLVRGLGHLLHGVTQADWTSAAAAAAILVLVSAGAALRSAHRAVQADAASALRADA